MSKKGVSLEDLLGKRQKAEVVSARMGRLENLECLIVTAKIEGVEYRYGILPNVIDKVLAAGEIIEERIFLQLPPPATDRSITWVNVY